MIIFKILVMSKVTIQMKSPQMMDRTLILNVKVTDSGNYSGDESGKRFTSQIWEIVLGEMKRTVMTFR